MKSIIMVGAGNLATQLGLALAEVGFPIVQVFSRTKESAQDLADKLNSEAITDINSLRNDAAVYIFSVKAKEGILSIKIEYPLLFNFRTLC